VLEYEKTFLPFCLLSKKRYVGMLYEKDPTSCKRKEMGIVLKRRDNAPIVKDVYGGIIDILMKQKNVGESMRFLEQMLGSIVREEVPMEKLIITKSLRSFYKNPQQIAHYVLAERIGVRDPGNKPSAGERIPFVYIHAPGEKLQGNRIETPDYVRSHRLKLDYTFYITNQIMKPVIQLYSLVLFDMPQFARNRKAFETRLQTIKDNLMLSADSDAAWRKLYTKKEADLKAKEVEAILFSPWLRIERNRVNNNSMITSFFKPASY
jgi:DNA polymerase elongation subunit (family B)